MNAYSVEIDFKYEGSDLISVVNTLAEALEIKEATLKEHYYLESVTIRQWQNGSVVWGENYYPE